MTSLLILCFCQKLETLQYQAADAATRVRQGAPQGKLFEELGLETLKSRWLFRFENRIKRKLSQESQENY